MKRLETIDWLTRANHQAEVDVASRIDIVFAMDDHLKNNFRKTLYPEYKAPLRYLLYDATNMNPIFFEQYLKCLLRHSSDL